ncbi:7-cyano-7-deazaguanine synthase [Candidatus Woesearchaeota archaeon]|nr:7-cyano-7-deazaguanine synthase [Candidatus Woesearchaeota archaeon]
MKAILLLSGGIDSPVAGYLAKQKDISLIALHFSLEPFTDNTAEVKSRKLSEIIGCEKFIVAPIGNIQAMVAKQCTHRYFYVITRRLMLRIAERIAKQEGCSYLITGDNLGQVGSQTLDNMSAITHAIKMPILRPLLSFNKNETIAIARTINTYEISKGPEMCSALGPTNPATTSTIERIESEENKIENYEQIVNDVIKYINLN